MKHNLHHSASLEMLFSMKSLLAKVKIFIFWPKTMDYNPWFDFGSPEKLLSKVCHTKLNGKRNLMALVSVA